MITKFVSVFLTVLLCVSSWGQDSMTLSRVSPKLRKFLDGHPGAAKTLSKTLSEAFSNKTIELYYFYTDDETVPMGDHFYDHIAGKTWVTILIRENQEPCDEYVSFEFEALNSEGEQRFEELEGMAKAGTISKPDFVRGIEKQELAASLKMQSILGRLQLSKKEIAKSHFYNKFLDCPSNFDEFISYRNKFTLNANLRDEQHYGQVYDNLRNGS
jgi:hypothetical protein